MQLESSENQAIIVEQLKKGSKEAFRLLFDAYGSKIHAFALSFLKNEQEAEELLQDIFLKLWERRANLDTSKNIKSFLFKICVNQMYDFIRHKNIEQAYRDYSLHNYPADEENTWDQVIYNDMLNNLEKLVAAMPEQRQRIFRLSKEEGLSNDEIATKLNLSKRTVENQLYRAISFLKERLGTGSLPALLFFFLHCK